MMAPLKPDEAKGHGVGVGPWEEYARLVLDALEALRGEMVRLNSHADENEKRLNQMEEREKERRRVAAEEKTAARDADARMSWKVLAVVGTVASVITVVLEVAAKLVFHI